MKRGTLFYIIGGSGCGKDSVMERARAGLSPGEAVFAHRYITRDPRVGGENHVALSEPEFQARLDAGLFSLHWEAHGYRYALGREIDLWMEAGLNVAANGSRAHLDVAAKRYPDLVPVLVEASPETLLRRMTARNREAGSDIEERMRRAEQYAHCRHPNMAVIDNSGELDRAAEALAAILRKR